MKITITPTGEFHTVNGVRARVWKGVTDKGVACTLYIPLVQVRRDADNAAFEAELREVEVERQLSSFDFRMVV